MRKCNLRKIEGVKGISHEDNWGISSSKEQPVGQSEGKSGAAGFKEQE